MERGQFWPSHFKIGSYFIKDVWNNLAKKKFDFFCLKFIYFTIDLEKYEEEKIN